MYKYNELPTRAARIAYAQEIESEREAAAYDEYTKSIVSFVEDACSKYEDNRDKIRAFDAFIKSAKARLSARFSHAAKAARSVITLHYIHEMSKDASLNISMSVREVDAVCRYIAGSSVQKTIWSGWFKGRALNDKSPYFSDKKYREKMHAHEILVRLKDELKELDELLLRAKANRNNQHQQVIDLSLKKLFS